MQAELTIWTQPKSYAGYNPEGHIIVMTKSRDSDSLSESNWDEALERLSKAWGGAKILDLCDAVPTAGGWWNAPKPDQAPAVYVFRASCSLFGWHDSLMVRSDAPQAVLDEAQEIADDLAGYPALNEDDWSQREFDSACEAWEGLSIKERIQVITYPGGERACSIFACRRDSMPSDDQGYIEEQLRS